MTDMVSDEVVEPSPPAYNDDVMDVINRLVDLYINADPRDVLGEELDFELPELLRPAHRRTDPRTKQFSLIFKLKAIRVFETCGSFRQKARENKENSF